MEGLKTLLERRSIRNKPGSLFPEAVGNLVRAGMPHRTLYADKMHYDRY